MPPGARTTQMRGTRKFAIEGIAAGLCLLMGGVSAWGQLSDLRHSRAPLPGLKEVSQVGLMVDVAQNPHVDSTDVMKTIQPRLERLGYSVVLLSSSLSEPLGLHVQCQSLAEKGRAGDFGKRSATTGRSANSRLGPPCQISYTYQGQVIPWKNVERYIYSESVSTMKKIDQIPNPLPPRECIQRFFYLYDFPVLLAAEWGHLDRIIRELNEPKTPLSRRRLIIRLLGEIQNVRGFPVLVEKLQDASLVKEAAEALGFFGLPSQHYLLPLLRRASDPLLQTAAAKGLGRVAAMTGDSQQTPLFLSMVVDSNVDIRVKTELVWAIGKAPDQRALPTLLELERQIWTDPDQGPYLRAYREAVDWSIREVKQGGHGDDY